MANSQNTLVLDILPHQNTRYQTKTRVRCYLKHFLKIWLLIIIAISHGHWALTIFKKQSLQYSLKLNAVFEPIQKRAVKWILGELNLKYNENEYISKLKLLDLLPLQYFFQLKKLKLFHRIRNGTIAINMPPYVIQHHLAHSSSNNINKLAVSTNLTQPIIRPFGNSFFRLQ